MTRIETERGKHQMDDVADSECVLWYMRFSGMAYDPCSSELEAALKASWMYGTKRGYPVGVQFSSGAVLALAYWPLFAKVCADEQVERDVAQEWRQAAVSPVPVREITDPFYGLGLAVYASEPEWLGRRW